jgi:hypothetical protein
VHAQFNSFIYSFLASKMYVANVPLELKSLFQTVSKMGKSGNIMDGMPQAEVMWFMHLIEKNYNLYHSIVFAYHAWAISEFLLGAWGCKGQGTQAPKRHENFIKCCILQCNCFLAAPPSLLSKFSRSSKIFVQHLIFTVFKYCHYLPVGSKIPDIVTALLRNNTAVFL